MDSKVSENREKNPRENASWISIVTFSFVFKIFRTGWRGDIQEKDVYEIVPNFSSTKLGNRLEAEWNVELKKPRTSFLSPLFRIFWKEWVLLGASLMLIETILMIANPILVGKLVSYFTPGQTEVTLNKAFLYTGELIAISIVSTLFTHLYLLLCFELGFKIKIACCTLIYRKCLRLSSTSLLKCTNGLVVTLMTKDVLHFDNVIDLAIAVVVGLLQSIIISGIMYMEIGAAAILGVAVVWVLFPVQGKRLIIAILMSLLNANNMVASKTVMQQFVLQNSIKV